MTKLFRVSIPYIVWQHIQVEAANEEEAKQTAFSNYAGLTEYAGNGGWDKLVGVEDQCCSVSAEDEPAVGEIRIQEVRIANRDEKGTSS